MWRQGTNISRGTQRRWLLPGYSIALVPKVGEIFENSRWGSCSEGRRRVWVARRKKLVVWIRLESERLYLDEGELGSESSLFGDM